MTEQILYTALVTPFDQRGHKVDIASLEACLKRQEKAQNGVVLFGSTGEGLSLSFEERKEILNFALSLKLNIPIIVGAPSYNLKEALEWISFSRDLVSGFLLTAPIYSKPGVTGQTLWFETLLDHAHNKIMLYNHPGRTGIRLHTETVKNLLKHKNLWAIKDSGGLESALDYKMVAPDLKLYAGDDYIMPALAIEGAAGLVSVASNVWPEATRKYVEHCLSGKIINSKIWYEAGMALGAASNPIPIKAFMKDLSLITNDTVRLPLSQKDHEDRSVLCDIHEKIFQWANA